MTYRSTILTGLLTFCTLFAIAGGKSDKVSVSDLKIEKYAPDPEADAHVVYDKGYTKIDFDPVANDFVLYFNRELRIKIYNKEGFDAADFIIPLHNELKYRDEINSIKAVTYTLENGKMEKTKLEKKSIFEEDLGTNTILTKFTMPNVKEGSIIEVEYQIKSTIFWEIPTWEFQSDIPVEYSEYQVDVPEYFHFKENVTGYSPLKEAVKKSRTFTFRLGTQSLSRGGSRSAGQQSRAANNITCGGSSIYYLAENMPALRDEPYMTTYHDYATQVNLQIEGVQMPGSAYRSVMDSWDNIINNWMQRDNYGKQFDRNWMDDVLAPLQAKYEGQELAVAIYEMVKNRMDWNGIISNYPDANLRKLYEERTGNAAQINFLLTALLRKAGFSAVPVITSTRDNGRVHPVYPFMDDYNYMLAGITLEGNRYYLDATDGKLSFGMLPVRALNKLGHEMLPGGSYVQIHPGGVAEDFILAKGSIDETGKISLDVTNTAKRYSAYSKRGSMVEAGSEEAYQKEVVDNLEGWDVSDYTLENATELYQDFVESYHLESESVGQATGANIYLNPVLFGAEDNNAFRLENRIFPVDLPFAMHRTYMMTLQLPEGYALAEAPQPQQVVLPNNGGSFTYNVVQQGPFIQVISKFKLDQLSFSPDQYPNLRQFFELVISKQAEGIVLTKQ